jgi:DNA-binding transcriptional MocR family regulator
MFTVQVDRNGPVPLHDQVATEIRRAMAEGEAGPGTRLPLAKDLAAILGVNKNTLLRALHILRDEHPTFNGDEASPWRVQPSGVQSCTGFEISSSIAATRAIAETRSSGLWSAFHETTE